MEKSNSDKQKDDNTMDENSDSSIQTSAMENNPKKCIVRVNESSADMEENVEQYESDSFDGCIPCNR